MRLKDRVCVVTGASSGIGASIAEAFAGCGARVIGFARRFERDTVGELPEAGAMIGVKLDVTDESAVAARFAEIPHVDVLINNAGGAAFGPVAEASVAELREMLNVHVIGTFLCCREALKSMRERSSGHIVTIGSTAVHDTFAGCAGYTAAKMGQAGISRVLREECRNYDVRVTSLSPGAVDTPLWDGQPDFDRSKMMAPAGIAEIVLEIVTRPALSIEDVLIRPPGGNL